MNGQVRFLIDADVLIRANNGYYSPEFCKNFWPELSKHCQSGNICTIRRIKAQWEVAEDFVKEWVLRPEHSEMFKTASDEETQRVYRQLLNWVEDRQLSPNSPAKHFLPEARERFASDADGWLVAYAKAHNYVLVTLEVSAPNARKNVKIPDCCQLVGVECINTFDLIRRLKITF